MENIEIFPTAQPYNTSLVRASYADDPESYDGVTRLHERFGERWSDGARGIFAARAIVSGERSLDAT